MTFDEWFDEVAALADKEGFERDLNPPPEYMAHWQRMFDAGLTPKEAWDSTPFNLRLRD